MNCQPIYWLTCFWFFFEKREFLCLVKWIETERGDTVSYVLGMRIRPFSFRKGITKKNFWCWLQDMILWKIFYEEFMGFCSKTCSTSHLQCLFSGRSMKILHILEIIRSHVWDRMFSSEIFFLLVFPGWMFTKLASWYFFVYFHFDECFRPSYLNKLSVFGW